MSSVVQVMQIIFYSVGTLFMICFMIIGIWAFVLYNKMFKNSRIQNYLLQKIDNSISSLNINNNLQNDSIESYSSLIEESLFENSTDDDNSKNDSIYKVK